MITRSILSVAMACACLGAALLQGCGGSSSAAGTYELDKAAIKQAIQDNIAKAEPDEREMMQAMAGMVTSMIDQMSMTMTLNADGSATGVYDIPGEGKENVSGTWTLSGSAITISMAPEGEAQESMSGTYANGVIRLENPDAEMTMVFRKR